MMVYSNTHVHVDVHVCVFHQVHLMSYGRDTVKAMVAQQSKL